MLANVTPLAKVEPFGFVNCLEAVYKFISKSPLADWQTGTGGHPIGEKQLDVGNYVTIIFRGPLSKATTPFVRIFSKKFFLEEYAKSPFGRDSILCAK